MSTAAHNARIRRNRERISHLSGWIRGDIGILVRGMWQGLALVVIVWSAHVRDGWWKTRAHILLLLLRLLVDEAH